MELCEIEPGQFFRKSLPQTATQEMLKMATMRPEDKSRYIKSTVSFFDGVSGGRKLIRHR
jgi:hypothetical protein